MILFTCYPILTNYFEVDPTIRLQICTCISIFQKHFIVPTLIVLNNLYSGHFKKKKTYIPEYRKKLPQSCFK